MTQAIANKKPPYLLMYICTLVYLVVTAFFEEGVAYFDPVYTTLMSSTEFYLTFSLCAVLFLTVVSIARRYFGIRINWVFFSLVVLLFLIDVVAICSFPEWTVLTGVYHVTISLKLRYITFWLAACMAFYVFFAIMPKSVNSTNSWNFYFVGGVFIAVTGCLFSYVNEPHTYESFFDSTRNFNNYIGPVSFTNNRNTYGSLLLIGFIFPIIAIFLLANVVITLSKASIFCSLFFVLFYIIATSLLTFKRRPVFKLLILIFVAAIFVFPFLIKPLGLFKDNPFFVKLGLYMDDLVSFDKSLSFSSLSGRANIWSDIFPFVFDSPVRALFGIGDWNFSWFLGFKESGSLIYIESAHSGFFDVLGRSGLFGCLFLFGLVIFLIVIISKTGKVYLNGNIVSFGILLCALFHGLFEDTNFLNMQTKAMMFLFITFMPPLTNFYLSNKHDLTENWENEYSSAVPRRSKTIIRPLSLFKLTSISLMPIYSIFFGLSKFFSTWNGASIIDNVFFQLQIVLFVFFIPLFVYSLSLRIPGKSRKSFRVYLLAGLVWSMSCVSSSFLSHTISSFLLLLLSGFFLAFLGIRGIDRKNLKLLFFSFLSCCCIGAFLTVSSKIIVMHCLIPDEIYQPYAAMCLVIFDFVFPFMIIVASPLHELLIEPLDDWWWRVEDSYRFLGYRYQVKDEIRFIKATQRQPVLRSQK
jgi:hypothetical protein